MKQNMLAIDGLEGLWKKKIPKSVTLSAGSYTNNLAFEPCECFKQNHLCLTADTITLFGLFFSIEWF